MRTTISIFAIKETLDIFIVTLEQVEHIKQTMLLMNMKHSVKNY